MSEGQNSRAASAPCCITDSDEYQNIISDPELSKLASVLHFSSVDETVAWAGVQSSCPPSIPPYIFQRLQNLYRTNQETCIISGHDVYYRWRPLLADIFCFFEYFYEDGAGAASNWSDNFDSTYSHVRNQRILLEDRNNYSSRIAIRDSKNVTRIELLRAMSIPQKFSQREKFLRGGRAMLTNSQMKFTSIKIINETFQQEQDSTHQKPKNIYEPMKTGELVIRCFGMKDVDGILTSYNVLPHTISTEPMTIDLIEKEKRLFSLPKLAICKKSEIRVHRGFWKQYLDIQAGCLSNYGMDLENYIIQEFRAFQRKSATPNTCRIVFTGHSMGGALACIAAYRIFHRFPTELNLLKNIYIIMFGTPKFARKKFAEWIEQFLANNFITLEILGDPTVNHPPIPGWMSPSSNNVKLTSEPLEKIMKQKHGQDIEWEPFHFRYWQLMRQSVSKLQPCSSEQNLLQVVLWNLLEASDYEKISERIGEFVPLLNISRDRFGQYPLHHVCCLGLYNLVALFLNHSADPNLVDFEQWTSLHRAYRGGHYHVAALLIKHGADVTLKNCNGFTPLHYVCRIRTKEFDQQIEAIKLLLQERADINAITQTLNTPIFIAIKEQTSPEVVEVLLQHKADVNASCPPYTPLTLAISKKVDERTVKLLLDYGASVDCETQLGTALDVAQNEDPNVLPILRFAFVCSTANQKHLPSSRSTL